MTNFFAYMDMFFCKVCLFVLLYVTVNNFSVILGRVLNGEKRVNDSLVSFLTWTSSSAVHFEVGHYECLDSLLHAWTVYLHIVRVTGLGNHYLQNRTKCVIKSKPFFLTEKSQYEPAHAWVKVQNFQNPEL